MKLTSRIHTITNTLQEPFRVKSSINILILIHLILFTANFLIEWLNGSLFINPGLSYLQNHFAISINQQQPLYWGSIFIHQFIHTSFLALFLNMSTLWMFGHLLKQQIGEREVVMNYLIGSFLAGVIYVASHYIFQIFSGHTILEGAYGGTLTLIAICGVFYRSTLVRFSTMQIPFWKISALTAGVMFLIQYQNNIAFILISIACIYFGVRYAAWQTQLFGVTESK